MKKLFITILIAFALSNISLNQQQHLKQENLSAIVLELRYNSLGLVGHGGSITIWNIETNKIFNGMSKRGFSQFVIIENLPQGTYRIEELKIISGPNTLSIRDESKFNLIKINEQKNYYIGSYQTGKIPPLMKLNFQILKIESADESAIYKQLKKRDDAWLNLKIDFGQSLFKNDSTNIQIKK